MRPILIIVLCLAVATTVVLMLSVHFALRLIGSMGVNKWIRRTGILLT